MQHSSTDDPQSTHDVAKHSTGRIVRTSTKYDQIKCGGLGLGLMVKVGAVRLLSRMHANDGIHHHHHQKTVGSMPVGV